MAYDHGVRNLQISDRTVATNQGVALTAAVDVAGWAPGLQPVVVRGVGVLFTTSATTNPLILDFYRRPTVGSDTSRVLIKRLNPTLAQCVIGNFIWADVDVNLGIGEDVIAEVVAPLPAAGNGHVYVQLADKWESLLNNVRGIKIA